MREELSELKQDMIIVENTGGEKVEINPDDIYNEAAIILENEGGFRELIDSNREQALINARSAMIKSVMFKELRFTAELKELIRDNAEKVLELFK